MSSLPGSGRVDAAPPRRPVLDVRDLQVFFPTDGAPIRAVDGVSLSVGEAETLAVVGESGSGKSVTGMSIMRLVERDGARIVGGAIDLHRHEGSRVDLVSLTQGQMEAIRGREIAMVFQDPMSSLNPVFPVGDQIGETLRVHRNASRGEARRAAVELLARVGIAEPQRRAHAFPHQLSGGMRQRVMLASAIACDPALLIADEPTTALDVTVQAQIVDLLREIQRERRMAMIFVSHDLRLVADIADRVAVMYANQVVEEGPVKQLVERPAHPYTRALLDCIPQPSGAGAERRRMAPIPGRMPPADAPPLGCRFQPRCAWALPSCGEAPVALAAVAADHVSRCLRWREVVG